MQPPLREALSTLLALTLLAACAGRDFTARETPGAAGVSPPAPGGWVVSARVTDAVVVESTTLGIEPSQPICVLTLVVTSSEGSGDLRPADGRAGETIQVYSKDTALVALRGGSLTASIVLRGAGSAARLWIVQLIKSTPPR